MGVKAWKSRGSLDESIKPPAKWDNSLNPGLDNIDISKFSDEINESCLKPDKVTFASK